MMLSFSVLYFLVFIFFSKQKTAYEMRISDWSSDVCSSDLRQIEISSAGVSREYLELVTRDASVMMLNRSPQNLDYWMESVLRIVHPSAYGRIKGDLLKIVSDQRGSSRSAESRVGKECVRTCRYRGSPYN